MLKKTHLSLLSVVLVSILPFLTLGFPIRVTAEVTALPAMVYPLMTPRVSSKFGDRNHPIFKYKRHHSGIDLAAPKSSPIRAVQSGQVIFSDPYAGYGNLVVIQHADGFTSHYGHCQSIKVTIGEMVKAGQIIAIVGSTGNSTGPHLHFELRKNGDPLDPEKYVPGLTKQAQG